MYAINTQNCMLSMIMIDFVAIGVKILRIDIGCSLEKEFTRLICISLLMILYLIVNHVDSFHGYVCGRLTSDTKEIL